MTAATFDNQAEAQDFYERAGPGDPHGLDADGDGRACDSNPCPCRGLGGGAPPPKRAQTIRSQGHPRNRWRHDLGANPRIHRAADLHHAVVRNRLAGAPAKGVRHERRYTEGADACATRQEVLLKTDPMKATFDRYDRLLAYVRLPGGRQLNKAQVAGGWANVYVVGRFQEHGSFRRAAQRAKRFGRGAWVCVAGCT